ncbi:rRNA N6-adenosine-methyltransferase ZCCHC4-like isoform X2 [Hydractinia symbiolongicarpus]|uniref:rRNA N6-adenosine-methyltransferase ZCCHC4-like isoform X2 n=1 Tax=Hydractinia symbiolongicarpus TaxID=13093 RepID=UPI00254D24A1|nr:rRNA N6-adenosine-methyltransferase ZCCHC4-like isoform X2 [Hydractinia symbiolongicarpus]
MVKGLKMYRSFGVDALVDSETEQDSPLCEHGPTLLFERFTVGKGSRKYYACSACRDRKECDFFQWADEKLTKGKLLRQKEVKKILSKKRKSPDVIKENDEWCIQCESSVTIQNKDEHREHETKILSLSDVESPSHLLTAKENKKYNAQYFFDQETIKFLSTTISRLGYKNILCIGTPRLFEVLRLKSDISVFLLDIDKRLHQFYSSNSFLQYNMFNNFFFEKNGVEKCKGFLSQKSPIETLIIVDPPFGGLVNILAKTLKSLWKMGSEEVLPTILVFPYFLESHVNKNIGDFTMLDYKVSYSNHPHYTNNSKNPRGSPVRVFTNIPADRVALPQEGYRFCKLCQRYVYKGNRHCKICKLCTSKDGRTYVHCKTCKKCVKPGRVHCDTCGSCEPANHECGREKIGCHICGDLNHKRRDCPQKKMESRLSSHGKRSITEDTTRNEPVKKKKKRKTLV